MKAVRAALVFVLILSGVVIFGTLVFGSIHDEIDVLFSTVLGLALASRVAYVTYKPKDG